MASEAFAHKYVPTGDVLQMRRLAEGLNEIGVDATYTPIIGDNNNAVVCDNISTCNEVCFRCEYALRHYNEYLSNYTKKCLESEADIYHIRAGKLLRHFPIDTKKILTAVPYSIFNNESRDRDLLDFELADVVTSLSRTSMEKIKSCFPNIEIRLIPICVNMEQFNPDIKPAEVFDNINSEHVIGYVGGTQNYQSLNELILYLPQIRDKIPDVHLLLMINRWGFGTEKRIMQLVKVMGLNDNVTVKYRVCPKDMPSMIKGCTLMHLIRDKSSNSMTPIKMLDFMAMEKPFIYSESDNGVRSLWNDKRCAIGDTAKDFVNTYIRLLSNTPETTCMRKTLLEHGHSHVMVAKKAADIYHAVVR